MTKLRERFNQLCQHAAARYQALVNPKPAIVAPRVPEPPARDLLTRGAGQIHKIGKPFQWKSP